MNRLMMALVGVTAFGCDGPKELPPPTDPDAIKKEQERLGGQAGKPKGVR